jgi:hypothetical protein
VTPATPSGTKEGYIIGGGTNAAPTFGASMLPGDGTYKMQGGADGASPYGFWFGGYSAIGVAPNFGMVYEPLVQTEAGDPSPYVFVVFVSTSTPFSKVEIGSTTAPTSINSPKAVGYIGAVATANWVAVPGCAQLDGAGNTLYPGGAGVGPFTAKDNTAPIRFGRSSSIGAPAADKGTSTIMRWGGRQSRRIGRRRIVRDDARSDPLQGRLVELGHRYDADLKELRRWQLGTFNRNPSSRERASFATR